MDRHVTATYRLHHLHICAQDGYVTTKYPKSTIDEIRCAISK